MIGGDHLIIVIDSGADRAQHLKEQIQFMDAPRVRVANVDDWKTHIGGERLAAVFVDSEIPEPQRDSLIGDVGEYDPNVSIVIVGGDRHNA